ELKALETPFNAVVKATIEKNRLDGEINNAKLTVFEDFDGKGRSATFAPGTVTNDMLKAQNFDKIISSFDIIGSNGVRQTEPGVLLQVVLKDENGKSSDPFDNSLLNVGSEWNDKASSLEITESPRHFKQRADAGIALSARQTEFDAVKGKVIAS